MPRHGKKKHGSKSKHGHSSNLSSVSKKGSSSSSRHHGGGRSSARPAGFGSDSAVRADRHLSETSSISSSDSVSLQVMAVVKSGSGSSSSSSSSSDSYSTSDMAGSGSMSSSDWDKHHHRHHYLKKKRVHHRHVGIGGKVSSSKKASTAVPMLAPENANEKAMTAQSKKTVHDEMEMTLHIHDSLEALNAKGELLDDNGNLKVSQAHGITVHSATPALAERLEAHRNVASNAEVARNPGAFIDAHRDIVQEVEIISAHSSYPAPIVVTLDSIQIPSTHKRMLVSKSANASKNALSFTLYPGENVRNRSLFKTSTRKSDAGFFSQYPNFNSANIREGVVAAIPMTVVAADGTKTKIERVGVPHTASDPHPVVALTQLRYPDLLTSDEKAELAQLAKSKPELAKAIPTRILSISKDSDDHVMMAKECFETMAKRCEAGINKAFPLSAMDHPHGVVGRLHANDHFSVGKKSLINTSNNTAETDWLNTDGTHIQRTTERSKSSALTTPYAATVHIRVKSIPTSKVNELDD